MDRVVCASATHGVSSVHRTAPQEEVWPAKRRAVRCTRVWRKSGSRLETVSPCAMHWRPPSQMDRGICASATHDARGSGARGELGERPCPTCDALASSWLDGSGGLRQCNARCVQRASHRSARGSLACEVASGALHAGLAQERISVRDRVPTCDALASSWLNGSGGLRQCNARCTRVWRKSGAG